MKRLKVRISLLAVLIALMSNFQAAVAEDSAKEHDATEKRDEDAFRKKAEAAKEDIRKTNPPANSIAQLLGEMASQAKGDPKAMTKEAFKKIVDEKVAGLNEAHKKVLNEKFDTFASNGNQGQFFGVIGNLAAELSTSSSDPNKLPAPGEGSADEKVKAALEKAKKEEEAKKQNEALDRIREFVDAQRKQALAQGPGQGAGGNEGGGGRGEERGGGGQGQGGNQDGGGQGGDRKGRNKKEDDSGHKDKPEKKQASRAQPAKSSDDEKSKDSEKDKQKSEGDSSRTGSNISSLLSNLGSSKKDEKKKETSDSADSKANAANQSGAESAAMPAGPTFGKKFLGDATPLAAASGNFGGFTGGSGSPGGFAEGSPGSGLGELAGANVKGSAQKPESALSGDLSSMRLGDDNFYFAGNPGMGAYGAPIAVYSTDGGGSVGGDSNVAVAPEAFDDEAPSKNKKLGAPAAVIYSMDVAKDANAPKNIFEVTRKHLQTTCRSEDRTKFGVCEHVSLNRPNTSKGEQG